MKTTRPAVEEGVTVQRRTKLIPVVENVRHFLRLNSATFLSGIKSITRKRKIPVKSMMEITANQESTAKGLRKSR